MVTTKQALRTIDKDYEAAKKLARTEIAKAKKELAKAEAAVQEHWEKNPHKSATIAAAVALGVATAVAVALHKHKR